MCKACNGTCKLKRKYFEDYSGFEDTTELFNGEEQFNGYSEFDRELDLFDLDSENDLFGEVDRRSSAYVQWVQSSLNKILGTRLATDGIIGPATRSAIRSFQRKHGLTVDGNVGPRTEEALIAAVSAPIAKGVEPLTTMTQSCDVLDGFGFNSDRVLPSHQPKIINIARRLITSQGTSTPIRSVRLVGHTDPVGDEAYNLVLGRRRAEAVKSSLFKTIERIRPGAGSQITFDVQTRGEREPIQGGAERSRRVDVCIPIPTPVPVPPQTWEQVLSGGRHGNNVTALIRGADTFKAMADAIKTANTSAHFIYLIAWWLSDDILLDPAGPHSSIRGLFMDKSRKGVQIRAMLWDQGGSHNDMENRRINNLPTGASILDNNTLSLGSHHQKILIVKGEQGLIAFCGGVDINPDRVRPVPPSGFTQFACPVSGTASPLHDVHCKIEGPAAFDLLNVFIRRWVAHPDHQGRDAAKGPLLGICEPVPGNKDNQYVKIACTFNWVIPRPFPLPAQTKCIQDRSLRDTMIAVIRRARKDIYIEDQYLVNMQAARELRNALNVIQKLIIVIGHSSISDMPQVWRRRKQFIDHLMTSPHFRKVQVYYRRATPASFGPYDYVHSKTWIIDEEVTIIGSANCNRRGWSHDSEVIAAIYDPNFARALKKRLLSLHTPVWVRYNQNESTDTRHCDNAPWYTTVDPDEGERLTQRCLRQPPLPVCPPPRVTKHSVQRRTLAS